MNGPNRAQMNHCLCHKLGLNDTIKGFYTLNVEPDMRQLLRSYHSSHIHRGLYKCSQLPPLFGIQSPPPHRWPHLHNWIQSKSARLQRLLALCTSRESEPEGEQMVATACNTQFICFIIYIYIYISIRPARLDRRFGGRGGRRRISLWSLLISLGLNWSHLVSHGLT